MRMPKKIHDKIKVAHIDAAHLSKSNEIKSALANISAVSLPSMYRLTSPEKIAIVRNKALEQQMPERSFKASVGSCPFSVSKLISIFLVR